MSAQTPLELAARIHDGPLQLLAAARQELDGPSLDAKHLQGLIEQAMDELRALLLAPPATVPVVELRRVLEWWVGVLGCRKGSVQLELPPELTSLSFMALEFARELLTNAIRHSSAEHIVVSIRREGTNELIVVEDDGVGIGRQWTPGYGLSAMYSRAQSAGGIADHRPRKPQGTIATVRLPPRSPLTAGPRLAACWTDEGATWRLLLRGDLDDRTVALMPATPPLTDYAQVKIDLTDIDYIDSAGLHAIEGVATGAQDAGAAVTLLVATRPVLVALDAVGFLERYDVRVADAA